MKKNFINNRRSLLSVTLIFIAFGLQSGCKKSSDNNMGTPGPNEVWIQNMAFNPVTITIAVNTTITWTNKDGITHTVTSDTGLFDSGNVASNGTYSHQFTTAGTYHYHCTIHPFMTAVVIVQ